jgi:hypothetical protein
MRRFVGLALAAGLATSAAAQSSSQPSLVMGVVLGVRSQHGLWHLPLQPVTVFDTNNVATGQADTFDLQRTVPAGVVIGVAGTFFPTSGIGVNAAITYFDLGLDNACTPVRLNPDPQTKNEQMCTNLRGTTNGNTVVTVTGGLTLRAAAGAAASPYVRAAAGVSLVSTSTIATEGTYLVGGTPFSREVLVDRGSGSVTLGFTLAGGLAMPVGRGYQVRVEVRDDVIGLERATGPATALGANAPTATKYYHHFGIAVGFDVVLERGRTRRY